MIDIKVFNKFNKIDINNANVEKLVKKILSEKSSLNKAIISIIFCNNKVLNDFKIQYFKEDVLTDIITFRIQENPHLEAELYISTEMAKENANDFNVTLNNEIIRLISHGILHLLGFDDKDKASSEKMFLAQEEIVKKFKFKLLDE